MDTLEISLYRGSVNDNKLLFQIAEAAGLTNKLYNREAPAPGFDVYKFFGTKEQLVEFVNWAFLDNQYEIDKLTKSINKPLSL